jgi:VanZ family protein
MEKKAQIISRILFCLYVTAVILLCIIKTESLPELPKTFLGIPLDKIAHFIMFLPFPILSYATFCHKDSSIWRDLALMAIICITGGVFAYSTEILQSMTDYRSSDIMDIAADGAGLLSGTLATIIYIIFRK